MQRGEKILDGLLFRPEVAVQHGQGSDWALSLLGDYLVQRRVGVEVVARILGSVHLRPPHFEYTSPVQWRERAYENRVRFHRSTPQTIKHASVAISNAAIHARFIATA